MNGKVRVEVVVGDMFGGHITLCEKLELQTGSMIEISDLLEMFHSFVEQIRDKQAGLKT